LGTTHHLKGKKEGERTTNDRETVAIAKKKNCGPWAKGWGGGKSPGGLVRLWVLGWGETKSSGKEEKITHWEDKETMGKGIKDRKWTVIQEGKQKGRRS